MRTVSVSVLVASALVVAPAGAKAPSPATPAVVLTGAEVSGSSLRTTIDVSFAVPAGAAPTRVCAGRVRATTKLTARKRRTLSGSLTVTAGRCHAALRGSLPKAFLGRKAVFRVTFAGNPLVRPFARTKAITLDPPPPPPAPVAQPPAVAPPSPPAPPAPPSTPPGPPATSFFDPAYKGTWGTDPPTTGVNDQWVVTITSSGVVGVSSFGSFAWLCGAMDATTQANWNLVYQDTGSFTAPNHAEDTATHVSGNTNATVHWTLDFDGPSLGTGHGTMSASGQYDYGAEGVKNCHMTAAFTFYRSGS